MGVCLMLAACATDDGFIFGGEEGVTVAGDPPQPPVAGVTPAQPALAPAQTGPRTGVPVNAFLWRATLDTLSFMPLESADPFGGVVITDWRATPEAPNERVKVQAYILASDLRADAVRVSVLRQTREKDASPWVDAPVAPETGIKLENAILQRARQLRVDSGG